jgi:hypothetical protein
MRKIKAIVRMIPLRKGEGKGKGRRATFASQRRATYNMMYYALSAVKPGSKEAPCKDRVSWIGGNLAGHGVVLRKADLMAAALDCGHKHFTGRRFRHIILSCEPCKEDERGEVELLLQASAPLLAAELGADRWIAVIHCDTNKPHMHMIIANYDPINRRRLESTPNFLSALQALTWTSHLVSGKGAWLGGHSARGQYFLTLRMASDPVATECALKKVYDFLEKRKKLDLAQNNLALWLASQCAEQSWDGSRLLKKDGTPRQKPVIKVDGIGLGLGYFRRYVRRSLKKTTEKSAKKRLSRRITDPEPPSGPV